MTGSPSATELREQLEAAHAANAALHEHVKKLTAANAKLVAELHAVRNDAYGLALKVERLTLETAQARSALACAAPPAESPK